MVWYCGIGGQRYGPYDEGQVRAMIQAGQLQGSDLVWSAAHGPGWVRADSVPSLAPAGPPALPLPPPAPPAPPAWPAAPPPVAAPPPQPFPGPPGAPTDNATLMAQARACLAGRWWPAIGAIALVTLLGAAAGAVPFVGWIFSLVLGGPFQLGEADYFLATSRRQAPDVGRAFSGFQRFGAALGAYLLVALFVVLWALLLIIPGIVAAYRYAMTFYLLNDHPGMGAEEAIERSKAMMAGHKWRLFCLHCRFIGWSLLSLLTCGLGLFAVMPYLGTSTARFYDDLKRLQAPAAGP